MSQENRIEKDRKMLVGRLGLYLLVLILVTLVSRSLFFRADLTSQDLFSLSEASKKAVSTLKEPLTINVFFSKNLPAPANAIEPYLKDLLEEYAIYGGKHFHYRFFDVTAEEGDLSPDARANRNLAQEYGIYPQKVQMIEQDQVKFQNAYMGLVMIHGDLTERIQAITSTEGLEFKITSTIMKMNQKISALLRLEDKIQVSLVRSPSLTPLAKALSIEGWDNLEPLLAELTEEQNRTAYGRLNFQVLDGASLDLKDPKWAPYVLKWNDMNLPDGRTVPAGEGVLALTLSHGKQSVERQLLTQSLQLTSRGLEERYGLMGKEALKAFLEGEMDNLIDIHDHIGYLSSHETLPLQSQLPPQMQMMRQQMGTLKKFGDQLGKSYTVEDVSLESGKGIPDDIQCLIIAGPKKAFSDWELYQIDQFLMQGKSVAVFLDRFREVANQNQQMFGMGNQPVYLPLQTGLEKWLAHFGLQAAPSYVLDKECYVSKDQFQGEMPIYFAPMIQNEAIDHDLPFMKNIKGLIGLKLSPLEYQTAELEKKGLTAYTLFRSSTKAWEMKDRINLMPMMIQPPADEKGFKSYPLAVLLEGSFSSYFAGKALPEPPQETKEEPSGTKAEGEAGAQEKKPEDAPKRVEGPLRHVQPLIAQGKPGKLLLIAGSDMLSDQLLDDEGVSPNGVFLMNVLDHLNGRGDMAVMRGKDQKLNPIQPASPTTRMALKVFNVGGIPVAIIILGLMVWAGRRNRRRKIQALYARKEVRS